jgi:molecular chaperone GrpE
MSFTVKKDPEKQTENPDHNLSIDEGNEAADILEPTTPQEPEMVDDKYSAMETELAALQQSLVDCQGKANEYLDGWQRARADFSNYKKRIEREQSQVYQNAAGSILKRQLEVLDDLDRALKNRPQDGDGATWAAGIELVYRKLTTIMENEGVKVMQAQGQAFDPTLHEAISSEDSPEHESGQIIDVLQKGYLLGDRVLRPALVRVAR